MLHDFNEGDGVMLDINMEPITQTEVEKAIERLKNGKTAGTDGIQVELLKNGRAAAVHQFTTFCNKIWRMEKVPVDWRDGIIVPLPRKETFHIATI